MRLTSAILIVVAALALAPAGANVFVETAEIGGLAKEAQHKTIELPPTVLHDLSLLPEKVRATRERILEAANSGEIENLVAVMKSFQAPPVFSFGGEDDAAAFWKESYPDSEGVEILGILVDLLEMPYVHLDEGSAQEMYVWPYFYALPLDALTPPQKVELFRILTGLDWKDMQDFGAYVFYRVGISPDGTWRFFVAGD